MVQPTGVTVTAVPAASVPPAAASTMDVLPGAPGVSVTPAGSVSVRTVAESAAAVASSLEDTLYTYVGALHVLE
jgi:hypothetical protein